MSQSDKPNQLALFQALSIYLNAMRVYVVDRLSPIPGTSVEDLVRSSISQDQLDDFEDNLISNRGNIANTLDIGHFPYIVQNNWDSIFARDFDRNRGFWRSLRAVRDARNATMHPPLEDFDSQFAKQHINVILEVLDQITSTDAYEQVREISNRIVDDGPAVVDSNDRESTDSDIGHSSQRQRQTTSGAQQAGSPASGLRSACGSLTCFEINAYTSNQGERSAVRCSSCRMDYEVRTATVVNIERYRVQQGSQSGTNKYLLRVRNPDRSEDLIEFENSDRIVLDRGDIIALTYGVNGRLVSLFNQNLGRHWDFQVRTRPSSISPETWVWVILGGIAVVVVWIIFGVYT